MMTCLEKDICTKRDCFGDSLICSRNAWSNPVPYWLRKLAVSLSKYTTLGPKSQILILKLMTVVSKQTFSFSLQKS